MAAKDDDLSIKPIGASTGGGVDEIDAAGPAEKTQAVSGVDGTSFDAQVAAAVRSGRITPAQAQAQIIEQVVGEQLPPNASPEFVEQVRAEVEALLEGDPVLEELLRP